MKKGFMLIRKRSSRVFDELSKTLRTPKRSLLLNCSGIRGFTLIELLVVVLIIAILAAVALPQYTKAVDKSRATEMMLTLSALYQSAERYRLANDENPTSLDQLDVTLPSNRHYEYFVYENGVYGGSPSQGASFIIYRLYYNAPNLSSYSNHTNLCAAANTNERGKDLCQALGYKFLQTTSSSTYYYM
ncbi:prepilin-type N-terminal cleavage/methylation domain-containing protein [Parelusimicrobium proximum]|uniref:type IV pilin protein n=1 Tax=Parelusimicrobium proximum TaxID=3228953 RepID=UPI003D1705F7